MNDFNNAVSPLSAYQYCNQSHKKSKKGLKRFVFAENHMNC